jgi:hypothetical protein
MTVSIIMGLFDRFPPAHGAAGPRQVAVIAPATGRAVTASATFSWRCYRADIRMLNWSEANRRAQPHAPLTSCATHPTGPAETFACLRSEAVTGRIEPSGTERATRIERGKGRGGAPALGAWLAASATGDSPRVTCSRPCRCSHCNLHRYYRHDCVPWARWKWSNSSREASRCRSPSH